MKTFWEVSLTRFEDIEDACISAVFNNEDDANDALESLGNFINLDTKRYMIVLQTFKKKDSIFLEDTVCVLKRKELL